MPNIGPMELAIVAIVALIIFGPNKLPELGSSLGRGMREFKSSITGDDGPETAEPRKVEATATETAAETTTVEPTPTNA